MSEKFVLEFEIGGLPKLPNQIMYRHWRVRYAEAKRWKEYVQNAVRFAQERPATALKHAEVTLTRISRRAPDEDNLMASWKHCVDGLVEAGIIENDDPATIGKIISRWEYSKRLKEQRIRIRVEEK